MRLDRIDCQTNSNSEFSSPVPRQFDNARKPPIGNKHLDTSQNNEQHSGSHHRRNGSKYSQALKMQALQEAEKRDEARNRQIVSSNHSMDMNLHPVSP